MSINQSIIVDLLHVHFSHVISKPCSLISNTYMNSSWWSMHAIASELSSCLGLITYPQRSEDICWASGRAGDNSLSSRGAWYGPKRSFIACRNGKPPWWIPRFNRSEFVPEHIDSSINTDVTFNHKSFQSRLWTLGLRTKIADTHHSPYFQSTLGDLGTSNPF